MSNGIFVTLHSKTKCMIQSFNFVYPVQHCWSLHGVLIWLALIKISFLMGWLWGCKICLHTFLAICFTRGMHVQFMFTTRFEMLSVFIAEQELLTLGSYEYCKGLGDTLWTRKLSELVLPMNKFVTSTCNTIKLWPSDYWLNRTGPCSAVPLSVQSSYCYENILQIGKALGHHIDAKISFRKGTNNGVWK